MVDLPEAHVLAAELVGQAVRAEGYENLRAYPGIASASAGEGRLEIWPESLVRGDEWDEFRQ